MCVKWSMFYGHVNEWERLTENGNAYKVILIVAEWIWARRQAGVGHKVARDSLSISSPATRKPKKMKLYKKAHRIRDSVRSTENNNAPRVQWLGS